MPPEYRKRLLSDIWHLCSNCTNWPRDRFVSSLELPTTQLRCDECRIKHQSGECTTTLIESADHLINLKR
jgi:hypothetical protein